MGSYLRNGLDNDGSFREVIRKSEASNPFFTETDIRRALSEWGRRLNRQELSSWVSRYAESERNRKCRVAVVMAGNIPVVGFHDFLCVLLSGHALQVKLSSKDPFLLPFLYQKLCRSDQSQTDFDSGASCFAPVTFTQGVLDGFDAIIATGSGNTFRYFEYYFGKYPHILRRNRTSCAFLDGTETDRELDALADDVFAYYGLGCRNVSQLFVPSAYDFIPLLQAFARRSAILMQNQAYRNNYDYHKSIYLVNRQEFFDTGSSMLLDSSAPASPMSVVHYQTYESENAGKERIASLADQLQCVVGHGYATFGTAQSPALDDYADGIDTMAFVTGLRQVGFR